MPRFIGIIALSVLLLSTVLVQRAYGAFFDPYCPPWGQVLYQVPYLSPGQVQYHSDPLFLPPDIARTRGYTVLPPPRTQTSGGDRRFPLPVGEGQGEGRSPLPAIRPRAHGREVGGGNAVKHSCTIHSVLQQIMCFEIEDG